MQPPDGAGAAQGGDRSLALQRLLGDQEEHGVALRLEPGRQGGTPGPQGKAGMQRGGDPSSALPTSPERKMKVTEAAELVEGVAACCPTR